MTLCEVRIPTYKRPRLLHRALVSLLEQTCEDWRCVVFDDSQEGEAKDIVSELRDERVFYAPNPVNLGGTRNIDKCFETKSLLGGEFAFVLEDDNYVLPDFIRSNIEKLNAAQKDVLIRNQLVETICRTDKDGKLNNRTTINWVPDKEILAEEDLLLGIFLGGGISNGSIFWRTSLNADLRVGDGLDDAVLHEYVRTFLLRGDVVYSNQPLSVWRSNECESTRRKGRVRDRISRWQRIATVLYLRRIAHDRLKRRGVGDRWLDGLGGDKRARVERAMIHAGIAMAGSSAPARSRRLAFWKGVLLSQVFSLNLPPNLIARLESRGTI